MKPEARVAVIAAMLPELRPILKRFALRPVGSEHVYAGRIGSHDVVASVTSMGTEAATRATTRLLDAHAVDHVIVVGIAGGIEASLRIGDLVNPEVVVDEASGAEVHPTPLAGTPRARLLTTDVLHNRPEDLERLRRDGFVAVDMETAAIGAVAEVRALPWSVFRAISDRAGDPGVDPAVVGLARPDGTPDLAALARFLLLRPWRVPQLAALGRGMNRAVRTSTDALAHALGVAPIAPF